MSMELPSVAPLLPEPRVTTSAVLPERPLSRLSRVAPLRPPAPKRILDFDIETVAAGFADPDWVPQKITCVAWSWVGGDEIHSLVCGPTGIFGNPERRATMLRPLLQAIGEADMVTGHNIMRFDLPVVNAECMRLGLEPIRQILCQDTMKLVRAKGFKKGQDVLGTLYGTSQDKLSLSWQDWQNGYDEKGWETIRKRAESDVLMHKQLRLKLLERRLLKSPQMWRAA